MSLFKNRLTPVFILIAFTILILVLSPASFYVSLAREHGVPTRQLANLYALLTDLMYITEFASFATGMCLLIVSIAKNSIKQTVVPITSALCMILVSFLS